MSTPISDPANAAAIWSAVAASFAAIAAFLTWLAQIKTLHHTFRPEIALSGWSRDFDPTSGIERISFRLIKNIGRDSARQIVVNASDTVGDRPTHVLSTLMLPSLFAGESSNVEASIGLNWVNVAPRGPAGMLMFIDVSIWYWDALNVRHITTISLLVTQDLKANVSGSPRLAPGLYASGISTKSEQVWSLKLRRSLARLPIVGKRFRNGA